MRNFRVLLALIALFAVLASPAAAKPTEPKYPIATSKWQINRCGLHSHEVWLTFDDSGSATQVKSILKALRDTNVRAIFFPTGQFYNTKTGHALMMQAEHEGHLVGNHTYSHPSLPSLSDAGIRFQLRKGPRGNGLPSLMRPPGGAGAVSNFSPRMIQIAKDMGYQTCGWTVDTNDWRGRSAEAKIATVRNQIRKRGVVLMHMAWTYQSWVLKRLVATIRGRGLKLPKRVVDGQVVRTTQFGQQL